MSILLDFFGFTVLFIIQHTMMLSGLTGVPSGIFRFPRSIRVFLIGTDSCEFMYNPPHSDSASDAITDFITLANMNIGPLKILPSLLS